MNPVDPQPLLDVRIVVGRDGLVRVSLDGERVPDIATSTIADALEALAARLRGAS